MYNRAKYQFAMPPRSRVKVRWRRIENWRAEGVKIFPEIRESHVRGGFDHDAVEKAQKTCDKKRCQKLSTTSRRRCVRDVE